ncbi:sperm-associated antigen 1 [Anoplophora glabripennis]|uniref:sperm-associated antigen 1 n=1 Tax=Anoplophora glabripennis TaxID=217634 RepID=UPI000874E306|nr:sperm-associated antigen 1 [Anoplophora glabripennis]
MSTVDDLSKLVEDEESCRLPVKESLLSKYRIPIQNFEYEYIEKCTDGKELEKILHVLKSGEEGYFPHLKQAAEERLEVIKPKSILLRKNEPVMNKNDLVKDEMNEIYNDLESWMTDISKHNNELEKRKANTVECESKVREYKESFCDDKDTKNIDKRIKSTDYSAWDKYDPDTEILKMDLEEENKRKAATEEKPKRRGVIFNKFGTEAEAIFEANREKEKGNEFFKEGDYDEALHCYTHSVLAKPSVDNLNNRAVTYVKLKKYKNAIDDCDKVLASDSGNLKARLRKAEALEGLKMYEEAMECVNFVIRRDPNNVVAQELADKIQRQREKNLKNTRMKIVEIE